MHLPRAACVSSAVHMHRYMFLEHMRGWTLRFRLQQRMRPTPHQVYMWLKMITIALVKLHDRNIVHDNVRCVVAVVCLPRSCMLLLWTHIH